MLLPGAGAEAATSARLGRVYVLKIFSLMIFLFFSLGQFSVLFAAFWSQNLRFACFLLHFGAKIFDWLLAFGFSFWLLAFWLFGFWL